MKRFSLTWHGAVFAKRQRRGSEGLGEAPGSGLWALGLSARGVGSRSASVGGVTQTSVLTEPQFLTVDKATVIHLPGCGGD